MSHHITLHHIKDENGEPEHITVTVGDHEVWRAYADQLRENDWPLLVRGVATAVANVIRYLDEAEGRGASDAPQRAIEQLGHWTQAELVRAYEAVAACASEHPDRPALSTAANVLIHVLPPAIVQPPAPTTGATGED